MADRMRVTSLMGRRITRRAMAGKDVLDTPPAARYASTTPDDPTSDQGEHPMSGHPADFLNRRRFLQAGAAGLALAGLPALRAADDKKADGFGGFTVGIQSYTFRQFKLDQCL